MMHCEGLLTRRVSEAGEVKLMEWSVSILLLQRELWVRNGGTGGTGIAKTLPSTGWSQSLLQWG